MRFFGAALQSKSQQPLTSERLATARGMTNLVMTSKEHAVYKGVENDDYVRRPAGIVNKLVKAGKLPNTCYVEVVDMPDGQMRRSALFDISFADLSRRHQDIADYIDSNDMVQTSPRKRISPLVGEQTVGLLFLMVSLGHITRPQDIKRDALLQGLSYAAGNPETYKALKNGAAVGFVHLLDSVKEAS